MKTIIGALLLFSSIAFANSPYSETLKCYNPNDLVKAAPVASLLVITRERGMTYQLTVAKALVSQDTPETVPAGIYNLNEETRFDMMSCYHTDSFLTAKSIDRLATGAISLELSAYCLLHPGEVYYSYKLTCEPISAGAAESVSP